MNFLKQSTAYTFRLGPFVDATDAVTEENALTIAYTSVYLSKAGGAFAAKNDNTNLTSTGANGHYTCVLNATDTGTLGALRVYANISGALPVFKDFMVLPAMIYDSLVAGTDRLDTNVTHIGDTVQTARDIGASVLLSSGTGTGQVTLTSGRVNADVTHIATAAVSTSTAQLGVNVVNVGGSAVSATSGLLNANVTQISGVSVAADNAKSFFDGTGYAGTGNVIPTVTNVTTVNGLAANVITAAATAADFGAEIAGAVWDEAVSGHTSAGTTGKALDDTDKRGSRTVVRGTVGNSTTPSTTQFTPSALSPSGASTNQFQGRIIVFDNDTTTAALRGVATNITASSSASLPLLTFSALPSAPASGDTFSIV